MRITQLQFLDLKKTLSKAGYKVAAVVDNYNDLIAAVHSHKPHVITLDVLIKCDVSGYQIADKLLSSTASNILFITGTDVDEFNSRFITIPGHA